MAFLVGGLAAAIGCNYGPEEGMLKLPPRKPEPPEAARPTPAKTSPGAKKSRKLADEGPSVGK